MIKSHYDYQDYQSGYSEPKHPIILQIKSQLINYYEAKDGNNIEHLVIKFNNDTKKVKMLTQVYQNGVKVSRNTLHY